MNHEITVLEQQKIPALEKSCSTLREVLREARRQRDQNERRFAHLASAVESETLTGVATDDAAIANRVLAGGNGFGGVAATIATSRRDTASTWDEIAAVTRPLYERAAHDLQQLHRRLEQLKERERSRR